jgi:3-(3-hydroxy-phenyl)propionate hydroxylase
MHLYVFLILTTICIQKSISACKRQGRSGIDVQKAEAHMSQSEVIVVGAGPVGIVAALALFKRGISVSILETEPQPVRDQRAASMHPPTLAMLAELGVTDSIVEKGLIAPKYQFHDRTTGELVAEFDLTDLTDEFRYPFVLQYEQYKLTRDISDQFRKESGFDIRFSCPVKQIVQDEDGVTVLIDSPHGPEQLRCHYLIGADGGRSTVRKSQNIPFEGFTYAEKFIKIATHFDFQTAHPHYAYRNYFSDPEEWCNLFKVRGETAGGLWRAIFPTAANEADDLALAPENIERRLQKFFPKSGAYDVGYANTYSVSQRVAATFRKGRVLLAGDAAHVNNPIGGMGMNGGIHDAINLTEKLSAVIRRVGPVELLDLYSRQRRKAAVEYIQVQTIRNKKTLEERDPELRRQSLLDLRRSAEQRETARAFMRRASLLDSLAAAAAA